MDIVIEVETSDIALPTTQLSLPALRIGEFARVPGTHSLLVLNYVPAVWKGKESPATGRFRFTLRLDDLATLVAVSTWLADRLQTNVMGVRIGGVEVGAAANADRYASLICGALRTEQNSSMFSPRVAPSRTSAVTPPRT